MHRKRRFGASIDENLDPSATGAFDGEWLDAYPGQNRIFAGITSGWAVIRSQSILVELGTNERGDEERWQGPDHQWN